MSHKTKLLKIAVPLIIILAGLWVMKVMMDSHPAPEKEIKENPGLLVEVFRAGKEDRMVVIRGTGTVKSAREVSVIPQVSGSVIYRSSDLVVGGFFKKGEILFEIQNIDYRLALQQAEAASAKAEYELATIESRARIARTEWKRINRDDYSPPNALVLYGPQLKNARAALAAANAAVEQAMINVERTKIRAPFNSRVRSENIDTGQYVRAGSSVAVLAGTETCEIIVPLTSDDLYWLTIPASGAMDNAPGAVVRINIREKQYEWEGRVIRSTGEVDPRNRMMQVVVEVKDPYGLKGKKETSHPALAAGTFVGVRIKGKILRDVFAIPAIAFRDDSTVWVMESEDKLRIKKVVSVKREADEVIISEGLDDGDIIIKTNIPGAADGMKLRKAEG